MSRNTDAYKLWQHANRTYYLTWTDSGQHPQYSKRVSTGKEDQKTAEQFRAQFIAGLNNPAAPTEPTISYLLDRYRNERGVNTRSIDTIDQHLKPLKAFFGDLFPSHISNNLLTEYAKRRELSAGTILRALGILKAALHYAEGNRWIAKQPQFIMPVAPAPP